MADFPKQLLENPSGFPDLAPAHAIALSRMLDIIRRRFELAGYAPLETPLVERSEVLLAKAGGEIATQIYGLRLLNPAKDATTDEKDLALRFDHTVPLARYLAANSRAAFPFRRYAIGPVFRGERAKDGRYRQFIQADVDAVGDATLSQLHDAEMVAVISDIFNELTIGDFVVRINNRKALGGLLEHFGFTTLEARTDAMQAIDRVEKSGGGELPNALLDAILAKRTSEETLAYLGSLALGAEGRQGIAELAEVVEGVRALGVREEQFTIDLSIARGLDYYTGTVYETRLVDHADLGSIASGGRYEHLASAYSDREFPGVGISIGVTRLLLRLIKAGLIEAKAETPARVLITTALGTKEEKYFDYARQLRTAGIGCELYLAEKALDKQMHFADRKGFALALIMQEEQRDQHTIIIRNLQTGDQREVPEAELVEAVRTFG